MAQLPGVDPTVLERQHAVGFTHEPVLLQEVLEGLALEPGDLVLDATVGLGGHAEAILRAVGPKGRLIGLDRDEEALRVAGERLKGFGDRMQLIHGSFGELARLLDEVGLERCGAALFDLGVSSLQLEKGDRGFSFAREGPLDMRMDQEEPRTAAEIVNRASLPELTGMLRSYGEERWAGRIARAIVRARPLTMTTQLAEVVRRAIGGRASRDRIDPATRTFQAIRIAVNRELELLPLGLEQAMERLRGEGRIAVLAYHSLEDRIVKTVFREQAKRGRCEIVTAKPIRPSESEQARNPRCRSARLRIARRTG
ncbi:MAG: 16S rRNA (cytosine(1402)-N(4))-methyltransferase RsmH [Candidatus Omnitrophica bacterium]|nr:16S rRNA (cytosine(1402)-N(4))-methyltransferase RsmH [Candidatus Omnitrophota bacterium]